jgi:hypothetical protein
MNEKKEIALCAMIPPGGMVRVVAREESEIFLYNIGLPINGETEVTHHLMQNAHLYESITPIYEPWENLTKEIEVDGEKFKPSFILSRDYDIAFDYLIELIGMVKDRNRAQLELLIEYAPLIIAQKLIEWGFNVHNIEDCEYKEIKE